MRKRKEKNKNFIFTSLFEEVCMYNSSKANLRVHIYMIDSP